MPPKAKLKGKDSKDKISELPDVLLVHILSLLTTKQAVTTMFLSKRWRFVWTMLPKLEYIETATTQKSVWNFLDKSMRLHESMRLHKEPPLESLCIHLYRDCSIDADIGYWVTYAVKLCVRELNLRYPRGQILPPLPACLYTCETLVELTLSNINILVDVPLLSSLPSLQTLCLDRVVYKEEDSHVKLLSSCPVLKHLVVSRASCDNVTSFIVKVPSLERLDYMNLFHQGEGSLFIDSPGLNHLEIHAPRNHNCSIQKMPRLDVADLCVHIGSSQNDNFLTYFSSVISLNLSFTEVVAGYCSATNFSRLIELKLSPNYRVSYTLEAVMLLLHNAPKLKVLMIDSCYNGPTLSWNHPSSVPECLLSHLEIFEWASYKGKREENEMVAYILANSNCLKTVGICPQSDYSVEEKQKMTDELKSMYRVSSSSQLLFTTQLKWRYRK